MEHSDNPRIFCEYKAISASTKNNEESEDLMDAAEEINMSLYIILMFTNNC
jgi:hypothetical protein